jgi:hypothetical protein
MSEKNKIDYIAVILISVFFILLSYAGYLSYKSIDWGVLKRMESAPLGVPSPVPVISVAPPSTPSIKK